MTRARDAADQINRVNSSAANATAITIDANENVGIDATLSVGVDDTGYDVKFFGATASAFMQWDASTDDLILGGVSNFGAGTATPQTRIHSTSSQEQLTISEGNGKGATFDYRSSTGNLNIATNGANARSAPQFTLDLNGAVTMPLQPAFLAQVASAQTNLANYVNVLIFGTEIFDQNADFNPSNGIFTAPVTGKYMLSTFIGLDQIPATGTGVLQLQIVVSNRTVYAAFDPIVFDATSTKYTFTQSLLLDMDASDTAKIQIYMPVSSSTVDINTDSYFSGYLVA